MLYQHLNSANQNIDWTTPDWNELNNFGMMADYLDLQIKLVNGYIEVEDNSHSDHNYISKSSCHPPSVFKGLSLGLESNSEGIVAIMKDLIEK